MKRTVIGLTAVFLSSATTLYARTNVDLNVNIGTPPVVVREVPSRTTTVIIDDDPEFVYAPRFGFYIGFGIPLDIIYFDGFFWLHRDSGWHRGYSHSGPWYRVKEKHVPWEIRRYDIVTIREYRDREYVVYQRERDRYPHRHFRPDREWHEKRKHERDEWKKEKRRDHDEWKREKRHERDEWREKRHERRDERIDDRPGRRDDRRGGHDGEERERGKGRGRE
ncbi:MAG: hypothetical protein Fur0034_15540 [Desulfuromonadia bacterium]